MNTDNILTIHKHHHLTFLVKYRKFNWENVHSTRTFHPLRINLNGKSFKFGFFLKKKFFFLYSISLN